MAEFEMHSSGVSRIYGTFSSPDTAARSDILNTPPLQNPDTAPAYPPHPPYSRRRLRERNAADDEQRHRDRHFGRSGIALSVLLLIVFASRLAATGAEKVDPAYEKAHADALRRAKVWFPPETPLADADLSRTTPAVKAFQPDATVSCRFKVEGVGGSTPKFVCELPDGDDVKVKYGRANAEIYTEVLATRLLGALGFAVDRMYPVARVRCYGCPADPYAKLQCLNEGQSKERCFPATDYSRFEDFDAAVIERPLKGRRIETDKQSGWGWGELAQVDAAAGGASRAELDAFRLMAVFLGHWDNKPKNQRLLCVEDADGKHGIDARCEKPVAMIQDAGGTFGPDKLDLARWSATPIWAGAGCRVSMKGLPYGGSSFPDVTISEEGRQLLAGWLRQLSREQIRGLFSGARVSLYPRHTGGGEDVEAWTRAFEKKIDAIVNHAPCRAN